MLVRVARGDCRHNSPHSLELFGKLVPDGLVACSCARLYGAQLLARPSQFGGGVETITDPAFHVNRVMEDHVTWVKTSNIRKKILKYNDKYDDFDLVE